MRRTITAAIIFCSTKTANIRPAVVKSSIGYKLYSIIRVFKNYWDRCRGRQQNLKKNNNKKIYFIYFIYIFLYKNFYYKIIKKLLPNIRLYEILLEADV